MSLERKSALKVEEVVTKVDSTWNITDMWETLDRPFLPIDHYESKYRQFSTRHMRNSEHMTEYLDELVRLFRKARPGTFVQFQNEEVKSCLLSGLPSDIIGDIQGYLDLSAEEIARKYDLIDSQREALGIATIVDSEKALHVVHEKAVGADETFPINELQQILAYRTVIVRISIRMKLVLIVTRKVIRRPFASPNVMILN